MFKNLMLGIIAFAIVAASGVFIYEVIHSNSVKDARAKAEAQAKRDCSNKIFTIHGVRSADYDSCMASKGF